MSHGIERYDEDGEALAVHVETSAVGAIVRGETETQIDCAHKYPRSITRFLHRATTLATMSEETAAACIYTLPRGGKQLTGPSVRLAEIVASAYGNLQVAVRVLDADAKEIVAQGAAWDVENNVRVSVEVRRRITRKDGSRYDDDMIAVTGNAAASIALRNAIFRVVPRAYVDQVYANARNVAVGDARTLDSRRTAVFQRLNAMGATTERILARVGKAGIADVGLDELEVLIGIGTSIRDGGTSIDAAFPELSTAPAAVAPENEGRRIRMPRRGEKPTSAPHHEAPARTREPGEDDE